MKKIRYPVDEDKLHKKRLGKNTLKEVIVKGAYCTERYAGQFYHYTTPEGLMGILKTRTLYFTDSQFLNDRNERININEELSEFWNKCSQNYDKQFVSLIRKIRNDSYEDYAYSYMESDRNWYSGEKCSRYFIFSTSFDKDSISMWKYYAKANTYDGYCIGLASYALVDEWIDRETGVAVESGAVLYSSADKQDAIRKAVDDLYLVWCSYKISDELNEKICNDFKSWISIASLFFKNSCFESEQEYRFVAIVPKDSLNDLYFEYDNVKYKMYDFRTVNGVLTPFIRMPFNSYNVDDCWALYSIGICPCLNADLKILGLNNYIESLDYKMAWLDIYTSQIPLRY